MRGRLRALPLPIVGLLLWASAPPWPDGWDGLGFIASMTRFDLDHFSPHPPGYPVYVALLRIASLFFQDRMTAANAVAVVSAVVALGALRAASQCALGLTNDGLPSTAIMLAVVACPLVFRSFSAVGSEAPALACAALAVWSFTEESSRFDGTLGVALGLGVGVRASWAPWFLGAALLVPAGRRARVFGFAALGILAWAVPLLALTGARHLFEVSWSQALGHATRWGGSVLTERSRIAYLARDVFVDGFGVGDDALGIAIGLVLTAAAFAALAVWRQRSFRGLRTVGIAFGPYFVWVILGQNLRQEPRHVVPLVVGVAVLLGAAAIAESRIRLLVTAFFVLAALRTTADARQRLAVPPPGQQLVDLVRAMPRPDRVAVFGGASIRNFDSTTLRTRAIAVGSIGDVVLALGRMNGRPERVLVTDELDDLREWLAIPGAPREPLAIFSRPDRLDRKMPHLGVYDVSSFVWSLR